MSDVLLKGRRNAAIALGAAVMLVGGLASAARANTLHADCSNFRTTLAGASSGDTILLTGMCSGGSYTLPAGISNLTIDGDPNVASGFDGGGSGGAATPALSSPVGGTDGLTLSDLVFQHYTQSSAVSITSTGTARNPFTFSHVTFFGDGASTASGGGLSMTVNEPVATCEFSGPAVTVSGSEIAGNTAGGRGGGGALIDIECGSGSVSAAVTNDIFTGNTVGSGGADGQGGGLLIGALGIHTSSAVTPAITQSGNLFQGNTITGSGGSYVGGGELAQGATLTSVRDNFNGNTIPGPASGHASWGAGLAALDACAGASPIVSQASDLVVTGNTISAPSGGTAAGGGVYVGCSTGSYHLTLFNSTISGNSVAGSGGVAGIDGATNDVLTLANTIVYGDSGGNELGGFNGATNVSANYSDVCAIGLTTPFSGTGSTNNICADPMLANVVDADVHQTLASPTIDAGSNALVPNGLTTDYYGQSRIAASHNGGAATVDIGAEEHQANPTITDCSQLQDALNSAASGEVITLAAMCYEGSFTLPSVSNLTIQGAATGTNGFDGLDLATSSALSGPAVGLTLRNLTFQNYSKLANSSAVSLTVASGALPVIDRDRFIDNTDTSGTGPLGAALLVQATSPTCQYTTDSLTITGSLFSGNAIHDPVANDTAAGAGAAVVFDCNSPQTAKLTISGNTFTGNAIQTAGGSAYGAGLYVSNGSSGQLTAQQSGNLFQSNAVTGTSASGSTLAGAGEWLASVDLTSTADGFVGNSLPGPSGATGASEGAGLGIVRPSCGTDTATAAATNLVAAGNTIGAPSSGGLVEGAGVFVACASTQGTGSFHLTLNDSTVSANSGPGGTAGVFGESTDQLTLQNSILTGNVGAGMFDVFGFGLEGGSGSIAATYSDLCGVRSTGAFIGTGNICGDPKLVDASSGDVHETAASPTIDAGSNALVPSATTADYYGKARIIGTNQAQGIVDIGAAELQSPFPPPTTTSTPTTSSNPTSPAKPSATGAAEVTSEKASSHGVEVTVHCTGSASQSCAGQITLTTTELKRATKLVGVAARAQSKSRLRRVTVTVGVNTYGRAGGQSSTVLVTLNGAGHALLTRLRVLPVTVTVTQTSASGKRVTLATRKLTIHQPKAKHRKRGPRR